MFQRKTAIVIVLLLAAIFVAGCAQQNPPDTASYKVMTATSGSIGTYLTDTNGMTLYLFTRDTASTTNPVSVCTGTCVTVWPIFYSAGSKLPPELNANDFSAFKRSDGKMQTTYKGIPLYYYFTDKNQGDTNGQGSGGVWFVAQV